MSTFVVPYFGEAGAGPSVFCLYANASSSSQWRGLMEMLAGDYHAVALIAALRHRGRVKADSAARHFIDFWKGAGAWDRTPEQRKGSIATSVANVPAVVNTAIDRFLAKES